MSIKMINENEIKDFIKEDGIRVVNVFATWCGPCTMFGPILEEVSKTYPVGKVDIDKNRDFAQEMGIHGVPATFIYKDGELKTTFTGFVPMPEVIKKIEAL